MSKLDWTKPIEAIRESDGKVLAVTLQPGKWPNEHGEYYTAECPHPSESNYGWKADGTDLCSHRKWRIRNRQPTTVEVDAAVWERCVGLVREVSGPRCPSVSSAAVNEAREIAKLLPVEVDPDEALADRLYDDWTKDPSDAPFARDAMLYAIRKVRAGA